MNFDKLIPWLGAALTGGVPGLALMAAKEVSEAFGRSLPPEQAPAVIANATPEQLGALKDREFTFQERMQQLGFQHAADMRRAEIEEAKLYVEDTDAARRAHAADRGVFRLGVAVLLIFASIAGVSLYVGFRVLRAGAEITDPGTIAALFGLIGTIVGFASAKADQVISYFFGSSRGSKEKTDAMSAAFARLGDRTK